MDPLNEEIFPIGNGDIPVLCCFTGVYLNISSFMILLHLLLVLSVLAVSYAPSESKP